jgi:hypothetical protein
MAFWHPICSIPQRSSQLFIYRTMKSFLRILKSSDEFSSLEVVSTDRGFETPGKNKTSPHFMKLNTITNILAATKEVEPNVSGRRGKGGLSTLDVKPPQKAVPKARKPEVLLVGVSILGSVFLTILLVVALAVPNPPPLALKVLQTILALAAAGVAAIIPGFLNVKFTSFMSAGGALGIFAIVFFCKPADVAVKVAERIYRPPETTLRELIDNSQRVYDQTSERMAAGIGTFEAMIDAHRRLVKRKLDACLTSEERVAVWKDAANTAQDIADDQASRYEDGTVPEVNKIEGSEYQREVELELAKSKFEAQQ